MRESIGTSFLLNFIIIFIVFIFAFLAATFSYYKAYRINNMILHSIEKFEGYNDYSKKEINDNILTMGYERSRIKCKSQKIDTGNGVTGTWVNTDVDSDGYSKDGYCIYLYWDENPKSRGTGKNVYYSYGIISYMRLTIPIFNGVIKMPVYSKTYNIYHFPENA